MIYENKQGWVKADDITEGTLLNFSISRHEIELNATYRTEMQFKEMEVAGMLAKDSFVLEVSGYDDDRRELYEIPEFNTFMRKLFNACPHMFYFVNIKSFTYAILVNSIFTSQDEVKEADQAIIDYANKIGDIDYKITVSYYVSHHRELVEN